MKSIVLAGLLALPSAAARAWEIDLGATNLLGLAKGGVDCAREPTDCPDQMLDGQLAPLVWEAVWSYKAYLFNQAGDRWMSLPTWFVTAAQPYYPGLDLTRVRYAEGIETVHGNHITWGEHILFVTPMNLGTYEDVHMMLHELEHVLQYQEAGGEQPFLARYLTDSFHAVVETGSLDVHGLLGLEQAAEAAAEGLAAVVYNARP